MTAYLLVDHLINLFAPAALVAFLLVASSRLLAGIFGSKKPITQALWLQFAINFVVGSVVLLEGLVLLGRDGKMLTYLFLVLAVAASQWWQLGSWKR